MNSRVFGGVAHLKPLFVFERLFCSFRILFWYWLVSWLVARLGFPCAYYLWAHGFSCAVILFVWVRQPRTTYSRHRLSWDKANSHGYLPRICELVGISWLVAWVAILDFRSFQFCFSGAMTQGGQLYLLVIPAWTHSLEYFEGEVIFLQPGRTSAAVSPSVFFNMCTASSRPHCKFFIQDQLVRRSCVYYDSRYRVCGLNLLGQQVSNAWCGQWSLVFAMKKYKPNINNNCEQCWKKSDPLNKHVTWHV